ncbi:MAG: Hint domain-containing protein, partial [Pseudomonadota bacterium]
GDLVWTLHRGWQPLRARHVQRISASAQKAKPTLRPIRIAAGSLGPYIPERPLVVSRQHRIYLNSGENIAVVGSGVLAAACALTDLPGISVCDCAVDITYVHLAFDHHEVVCAEGCLSESFFRGAQALAALPPILAATYTKGQGGRETPAAPFLSQKEARRHVARAQRKGAPLQEMPRRLEASA